MDEFRSFISILVAGTSDLFEDDMVTLLWSEHFQGLHIPSLIITLKTSQMKTTPNTLFLMSSNIARERSVVLGGLTGRWCVEAPSTGRYGWCIISMLISKRSVKSSLIWTALMSALADLHTTAHEKLEKFIGIFQTHLIGKSVKKPVGDASRNCLIGSLTSYSMVVQSVSLSGCCVPFEGCRS